MVKMNCESCFICAKNFINEDGKCYKRSLSSKAGYETLQYLVQSIFDIKPGITYRNQSVCEICYDILLKYEQKQKFLEDCTNMLSACISDRSKVSKVKPATQKIIIIETPVSHNQTTETTHHKYAEDYSTYTPFDENSGCGQENYYNSATLREEKHLLERGTQTPCNLAIATDNTCDLLLHDEEPHKRNQPTLHNAAGGTDVFSYTCDNLACGQCHVMFHQLTSFLLHKSYHHLSLDHFRCELCNKVTRTQQLLKCHYEDDHKVAMLFNHFRTEPAESQEAERSTAQQPTPLPGPASDLETQEPSDHSHSQNATIYDLNYEYNVPVPIGTATEGSLIENENVNLYESEQLSFILQNMEGSQLGNTVEGVQKMNHIQEPGDTIKEVHFEVHKIAEDHQVSQDSINAEEIKANVEDVDQAVAQASSQSLSFENDEIIKPERGSRYPLLLITTTKIDTLKPFTSHWFCCIVCDSFKTRYRNGFVTHMESTHPIIPIVDDNLRNGEAHPIETTFDHEKLHIDKKIFETLEEYDSYRPLVGKTVKRKLETQDVQGQYPCPDCHQAFKRLRYLRRHAQAVHKEEKKTYECSECGKEFKSDRLLEAHVKKVHQKISKQFQCKECDFKSCIKSEIHQHRQLHNSDAVLCDICGQAYTDRSTLKKHMDVHDPTRPFACTFQGCSWRFKSEMMKNAHERGHTSVGRFKCMYCSKAFRHKHHLQRHEIQTHGIEVKRPKEYNTRRIDTESSSQHLLMPPMPDDLVLQEAIVGDDQVLKIEPKSSLTSLFNIEDVEVILWTPNLQPS